MNPHFNRNQYVELWEQTITFKNNLKTINHQMVRTETQVSIPCRSERVREENIEN